MGAPKCKICNKSHWGFCNPKDLPDIEEPEKDWYELADKNGTQSKPQDMEKVEDRAAPTEKPDTSDGPVYDKGAKDRVRRWRDNNREAYNERQREYMRAYRKRKAG